MLPLDTIVAEYFVAILPKMDAGLNDKQGQYIKTENTVAILPKMDDGLKIITG